MTEMLSKVRALRTSYPSLTIQVDGGVGPVNVEQCAEAGADSFVSG